MDFAWMRTLAFAAVKKNGDWETDARIVREQARDSLAQAMESLHGEMLAAADVFNFYRKDRATCRILAHKATEAGIGQVAFSLFLGKAQLQVERRGDAITVTACMSQGYQMKTRLLRSFAPQPDRFGDLEWLLQDGTRYSFGQMIKKIFEDLVRCEAIAAGE